MQIPKPFDTPEEAKQYLSQPRIPCLLCGLRFSTLTRHIPVHSMSSQQYRDMFGIPPDLPLLGSGRKKPEEARPRVSRPPKALSERQFRALPEPFTTQAQVEEYFSEPLIECLMCGGWFSSLDAHVSTHGMSTVAYREFFGLPFSRPLAGFLYGQLPKNAQ